MKKRQIINNKFDSRFEKNFIFLKFWELNSKTLIIMLSNQAKQYFKN
jgi:hypothetical protein